MKDRFRTTATLLMVVVLITAEQSAAGELNSVPDRIIARFPAP